MTRDLGEQNLTLLEAGKKAATKAALDDLEHGATEIQVEALTTGEVEADVNIPITKGPAWLKGSTLTAFAKARMQSVKDAVGGFRITKKF